MGKHSPQSTYLHSDTLTAPKCRSISRKCFKTNSQSFCSSLKSSYIRELSYTARRAATAKEKSSPGASGVVSHHLNFFFCFSGTLISTDVLEEDLIRFYSDSCQRRRWRSRKVQLLLLQGLQSLQNSADSTANFTGSS